MSDTIARIDLNGVNCYLAGNKNGFILFDTGGHLVMDMPFADRRELLLRELDAAGCAGNNLNLIVLTHGDNDHACNAAYLKNHFNAKIAMHEGDRKLVENPTLPDLMESFQYNSPELQQAFLKNQEIITKVTKKTLDDFERFSPDILLRDGMSLSAYGLDATVIHVPGHTNGSIAILTKDGDLIAGDTLVNAEKPGYAFNAGDFKQLFLSVNKLRKLSISTVYPGHGAPFCFSEI